MRAYPILVLCGLSLGWLGCKSEAEPPVTQSPPDEQPSASTTPWAPGGTTGDFGGDCAACEDPELQPIELDDDEVLGFSPQEVLDAVAGVHVAQVRWRDACAEEECRVLDLGCPREPLTFGGAETELRVELEQSGEPTLETCPARAAFARDAGGYENCIGTYLHIPVRVSLATADGRFEATIEDEELFVAPGEPTLGVGGRLTPDQLDGTLASELPELQLLEWSVWFESQGPGADLYLLGEDTGVREENFGQLVAGGEAECQVGFPLMRAD